MGFLCANETLGSASYKIEKEARNMYFLGQLPFENDDLDILKQLIDRYIGKVGISVATSKFENLYSGAFSAFLMLVGMYHYSHDGNYWDYVWEQIGEHYSISYQTKWGQLFIRFVRRCGMEDFAADFEYTRPYVSSILLHGGIPKSCLRDYFNYLLAPAVTKTALDNASDIIDELYSKSSAFVYITKPVERFFLKGRLVSEHFLSESMELYESFINNVDCRNLDLPTYVIDEFKEWITNQSGKELDNRNGIRIKGPRVILEPYGAGVCLWFPEQVFKNNEIYDAKLVINLDDSKKEYELRVSISGDATEAFIIPLSSTCNEIKVSLYINDENTASWSLNGLDPKNEWYIFKESNGQLARRNSIKDKLIWVVFSESYGIEIPDDGIDYEKPYIVEECSGLPFQWAKYKCMLLSVNNSQKLILIKKSTEERFEIPILPSIPEPYFKRLTDLSIPFETEEIYFIKPSIKLMLPGLKTCELSQWSIIQEQLDSNETKQFKLENLIDFIGFDSDLPYLLIDNPIFMRSKTPGRYRIRVSAKFGIRWERIFNYLPGFMIQYPDNEQLWPNQDGDYIKAILSVTCPNNSKIIPEGHCRLLSNFERINSPTTYRILVPSAYENVSLKIIGKGQEKDYETQIALPMRPVTWTVIEEGESVKSWAERKQTISLNELKSSSKGYLLIMHVTKNIESVTLSLFGSSKEYHQESSKPNNNGYVRFNLSTFLDDIRQNRDDIFTLAVTIFGQDINKVFLVAQVEHRWTVEKLSISNNLEDGKWYISCNWREIESPCNRSFLIEDLFRGVKVVEHILDKDVFCCNFKIDEDELPPGKYRVSLESKLGWATRKSKPIYDSVNRVFSIINDDYYTNHQLGTDEEWACNVISGKNAKCLSLMGKRDQCSALQMIAGRLKDAFREDYNDEIIRSIFSTVVQLNVYQRLILFAGLINKNDNEESNNKLAFSYYSGMNYSYIPSTDLKKHIEYLYEEIAATTDEKDNIDEDIIQWMTDSWYPLVFQRIVPMDISVLRNRLIDYLKENQSPGVKWLISQPAKEDFSRAFGSMQKMSRSIDGWRTNELKSFSRELYSLDWFDNEWIEKSYAKWLLERETIDKCCDELYSFCRKIVKVIIKQPEIRLIQEGKDVINTKLLKFEPGDASSYGCKAYYCSLVISLYQRLYARQKIGNPANLFTSDVLSVLLDVPDFYERNLCLAEVFIQHYWEEESV